MDNNQPSPPSQPFEPQPMPPQPPQPGEHPQFPSAHLYGQPEHQPGTHHQHQPHHQHNPEHNYEHQTPQPAHEAAFFGPSAVTAATQPEPQMPIPPAETPAFVSPAQTLPAQSAPVQATPFVEPLSLAAAEPASVVPQPVVKVLSPRGVEYVFMTIALFTGAFGLGGALLSLVNGQVKFAVLAFPISLLVVALPTFAWLFLRLKKAELANPALRFDASKRRSTQFTQIAACLGCLFKLISFVAFIFAKLAGEFDGSIVKVILNVLVIEVVSGGILAYYWRDEHQAK
jgi:hypothetical protein